MALVTSSLTISSVVNSSFSRPQLLSCSATFDRAWDTQMGSASKSQLEGLASSEGAGAGQEQGDIVVWSISG